MQDDQWLRPREASWHLGVTVTTLAHWARAGRLPAAHTPGGHRRYRMADVQTLQAELEKEEREPQNRPGTPSRFVRCCPVSLSGRGAGAT
jgi:excisionase family DNA binding protein